MGMDKAEVGRRGSRITQNTIALAASGAAGMIFSLVQMSVLSRMLGADEFGLFVALRGFSLLLSTVILLGLPQVLIRFLPSLENRGQRKKGIALFLVSSAVLLLAGAVLYASAGYWRSWMPAGTGEGFLSDGIVLWMTLASVAMAFKLLLYGGFNGLREMRMQMFLEVAYLAVLTGWILLRRDRLDLEFLFMAVFVVNAAVTAAGYPFFFLILGRSIVAGNAGAGPGVVLPPAIPYWGYSILLSIVALAFTDVDRYVMTSLLPVSAISLFHVASRLNGLMKRFLGFPVVAMQPEITRIFEEGRWNDLSGRIVLFTKVTLIASLFFAGLAAVGGKEAILLLSGGAYGFSYVILLVLIPCLPAAALIAPLIITMRALHFMKWAVLCDFLWMATYFGSFLLLVPAIGVTGMAAAQLVATLVQVIAAIMLSKREGFFGGAGRRTGRAVIAFAVLAPLGVLATERWGLPAVGLLIIASPFVLRTAVGLLGIFDGSEISAIQDMIPPVAGKRIVAWIFPAAR